MPNDRLYQALELTDLITAESSLSNASKRLAELANLYGFTAFVLATFKGPGTLTEPHILATTWNEEWHARYIEQDYALDDPVVARGQHSYAPFYWSESLIGANVTQRGRMILDEAKSFNMSDGIFIPVYGPDGFEGTLAFGGERRDLAPADFKALHLAGIYAYNHVFDLFAEQNAPVRKEVLLTNRETECLKWSAAGKTSSDISELLGISRHTADWYLKEATRKLGALNRTHAVALAFRKGLIG
ncbi:MAG: autoinducer binding domain-containing protein [Roseibium sp.]|nr:autoinducer binding domain-containing protein [Roseibium sp.]